MGKRTRNSARPINDKVCVFVSYSHYDRDFVVGTDSQPSEFIRGLKALEQDGNATINYDAHLLGGDIFNDEIRKWLRQCDILVAVISDNFLLSSYCTKIEVKAILNRRRQGHPVAILPFYYSHCEWGRVEWLHMRQMIPSPPKSYLAHTDREERIGILLQLRQHLRRRIEALKTIAENLD